MGQYENTEEQVRAFLRRRSRFIIDPRTSKRIGYWDAITTLALIYTALVTPAEVALLEPATSPLATMFLVNRIIDAIFIVDMGVQFCMMAEVSQSKGHASQGTVWLTRRGDIARAYLKSWFALDLGSVLVSAFDMVGLDAVRPMLGGGDTSDLSDLKMLRVLRVLRLIKLARLIRSSRMIKRWESRLAVNYALLALTKAVLTLVFLAHWIACVWVLQARVQTDLNRTWLGRLGYCESDDVDGGGDSVDADGNLLPPVWDCPPLRVYSGGAYYAAATITSIGYGDITPTHHNVGETFVAVALMFTSCIAWAHLLGVFSGVVSTFNPERNVFRETMDALNRFITNEGLPHSLARRMREYFHQSQHLRTARAQQALVTELPPSLQGEVSWATNHAWLDAIPFLRGADEQFMLELSLHLHAVVFAPADYAPKGYLFIVQRGLMVLNGKVMTKGKIWGEDMVLECEELRSPNAARAMNYVAANYIGRTELLLIAKRFPTTAKQIRKYAIKLALGRQMMALARLIKERHLIETGNESQLTAAKASKMLFTTIKEASEIKKHLGKGALFNAVTADSGSEGTISHTAGGRLAGYDDNVGVQFEIMNARVTELTEQLQTHSARAADHAAQTASLASTISQMHASQSEIVPLLHALLSRVGLGADPAAAAHSIYAKRSLTSALGGPAPPPIATTLAAQEVRSRSPTLTEDRVQDGARLGDKGRPPTRLREGGHRTRKHRHRNAPASAATMSSPEPALFSACAPSADATTNGHVHAPTVQRHGRDPRADPGRDNGELEA